MSLPIVYHPDYTVPLPPGHRFPMGKYQGVYETLIKDGVASLDQFHVPELPPHSWLELAHDPCYVKAYLDGSIEAKMMRRIGFPWSAALVRRTRLALAGTVRAAELALEHGLACNTAGGTHHAYYDYGSGFCVFNDLAVAARLMLERQRVRCVLVIDLDAHQGDGTASICQQDKRIFTFSMHCAANFPFHKQQSDLDIALPVGMEDEAYLQTLGDLLPDLLSQVKPDLVFYDAGVDPHVEDELGKLALSDAGLYHRDRLVLANCWQRGIPTAGVIGGGYQRDIRRLAKRHSIMHQVASEFFSCRP
ncbi:MAG TPA: histone deacetylase [Caldilineaceae bacterium]|nr:histone deacetylase [Caldilineaceae bacterium]